MRNLIISWVGYTYHWGYIKFMFKKLSQNFTHISPIGYELALLVL